MALLKNNTSPLKMKETAHKKKVSFKAKFDSPLPKSENITPSHPTDDGLQSCSKRRRYMRRGSKCPSMFLLSNIVVQRQLNELELCEIQASIFQGKKPSLQLDHDVDARQSCAREKMHRRRSSLQLSAQTLRIDE